MIRKILIANRGEIAVRIIRACREMGVATVAVYSPVDRSMPHVRLADEAYPLAGDAPAESYLDQGAIVDVARVAGVDAVHPGCGFLAENPDFAQACGQAGLIFVGPSPECIRLMGDKLAARALGRAAGVATTPGTEGPVASLEAAPALAAEIGYPLMVKASAGGGGKGMRLVERPAELADAIERARSESRTAFGDDRVYLERYFRDVHHIEIQIFADAPGNVVCLGERECSIQRRHQKVVEETPSPSINSEQRTRMGEAAVALARACGYVGAGTVEFLFSEGQTYFLEMNTRLQVEHPITEMVTGVDLVKLQLQVASGQPLGFTQAEVGSTGHAMECRIYAEDPETFLASPGQARHVVEPSGPFVRVDSFLYPNLTVPAFYDPLLAKLVVWGRDRPEAVARMGRALDEYVVTGIKTNIPFHRRLMGHPAFLAGRTSTRFIEEHLSGPPEPVPGDVEQAMLAAIAITHCRRQRELARGDADRKSGTASRWRDAGRNEGLRR